MPERLEEFVLILFVAAGLLAMCLSDQQMPGIWCMIVDET